MLLSSMGQTMATKILDWRLLLGISQFLDLNVFRETSPLWTNPHTKPRTLYSPCERRRPQSAPWRAHSCSWSCTARRYSSGPRRGNDPGSRQSSRDSHAILCEKNNTIPNDDWTLAASKNVKSQSSKFTGDLRHINCTIIYIFSSYKFRIVSDLYLVFNT